MYEDSPTVHRLPVTDALLDALETDQQYIADHPRAAAGSRDPLSVTFRHSGWYRVRRLIADALKRTHQTFARQQNYAYCGSNAYVLQSIDDPTVFRIAGSACHDRFCLPCANERSNSIALNVIEAATGHQNRFLTLTIRSTDEPLAFLLDKLYASFQKLRRRKFWTARVTGGVAFLEIKWSSEKQRWHPHLHLIIQGRFLPQKDLSQLWRKITSDSYIVDIRLVRTETECQRYVTKYASKPFNNTFVNRPAKLDEAILAVHGRKLCITFGTWRGILLSPHPSDTAWRHFDTLQNVILKAAHGDDDCQRLLNSITNRDLTDLYARAPPPDPQLTPPNPDLTQLTFFAAWQRDGSFTRPGNHPYTTYRNLSPGGPAQEAGR